MMDCFKNHPSKANEKNCSVLEGLQRYTQNQVEHVRQNFVAKIVNSFQLLNIFAKNSILDVQQLLIIPLDLLCRGKKHHGFLFHRVEFLLLHLTHVYSTFLQNRSVVTETLNNAAPQSSVFQIFIRTSRRYWNYLLYFYCIGTRTILHCLINWKNRFAPFQLLSYLDCISIKTIVQDGESV